MAKNRSNRTETPAAEQAATPTENGTAMTFNRVKLYDNNRATYGAPCLKGRVHFSASMFTKGVEAPLTLVIDSPALATASPEEIAKQEERARKRAERQGKAATTAAERLAKAEERAKKATERLEKLKAAAAKAAPAEAPAEAPAGTETPFPGE
jgi:ribonuclease E